MISVGTWVQYDIKPGAQTNNEELGWDALLRCGHFARYQRSRARLKKFVNPYGKHDFIGKQALQQIAKKVAHRKLCDNV